MLVGHYFIISIVHSTYHALGRSFRERPFSQLRLTSQQRFQKSIDYDPGC